jgi:hypothetical protein
VSVPAVRRFNAEEYELLLSALRGHEFHLKHMAEHLPVEMVRTPLLGKMINPDAMKVFYERMLAQTTALWDRIQDLFHHDTDWLDDADEDHVPRWCLACRRRHEPHCDGCAGCLRDAGS